MDNKTLSLIQKIIFIVIAAIAAYFYIMILINKEDPDALSAPLNGMLRFTYVILVLTLVGAALVWLKDIITHPKKLMQTLIFVGLFALVVLVAKYALASNEPVKYSPSLSIDANTSNWVDTGLFTFYILAGIAILLMILSPVLSIMGSGNRKIVHETVEGDQDVE